MKKRIFLTLVILAPVLAVGVFFGLQLSAAGSAVAGDDFYMYQIEVYCKQPVATKIFNVRGKGVMGTKVICVGACESGTVSADSVMSGLPAAAAASFRTQLDQYEQAAAAGNAPSVAQCLGKTGPSKDDGKKRCDPPTPWFDPSGESKCKDRQQPKVVTEGATVFLQLCGTNVFAQEALFKDDPLWIKAYSDVLLEHARSRIGDNVCCDRFKASSGPGAACDVRFDVDCDGISNASDVIVSDDGGYRLPDITIFSTSPDFRPGESSPLPPWFTSGDKKFMPPADKCDCKWQVAKGIRTCSPDGRRPHVYQITWKCPSTGNVKFTRKEAPATEQCAASE